MEKDAKMSLSVLVAEDDETLRDGIHQILHQSGYAVTSKESGEAALKELRKTSHDLLITDHRMAGMNGLELLGRSRELQKNLRVIIITAYGTVDLAVEAMKAGADDFICKPFSKEELIMRVKRLAELLQQQKEVSRLSEENAYLRREDDVRFNFGEIVGESPPMRTLYGTIAKISQSEASVLISGESGTGKELVARAIHKSSPRRQGPFIRVNCGALAEGVLESELFGHEKGAFTGALRTKKGRFELADQGTLFLDEIGDIPPATQVKLLRVLQEKEFERVGGEETLRVDVRVIAATNRDLAREVKEGGFREDLFYRLFILPVHLSPLRERREDIPLLAAHFLGQFSINRTAPPMKLTDDAVAALTAYHWPGNIRELGNVLERAVVLASGSEIDASDLRFLLNPPKGTDVADDSLDLEARLAALEKKILEQALNASGGVKARAARLLGLKESTLYYKLEKHGLV